jgi:hypothetical protein
MRRYVILSACAEHFADETFEGTHEGYPTYVAIKVDQSLEITILFSKLTCDREPSST